jgi:xylan 1,4-beta-xylosidase
VFTGRQGLLSEFTITPDGWIAFADEPQTKEQPLSFSDNFKKRILANSWEWSVFQPLDYRIRWKKFNLSALPANAGSFVAQKNTGADYIVDVMVLKKKSSAAAGVAAIGDEKNVVTALLQNDSVKIIQWRNGNQQMMGGRAVKNAKKIKLRMEVRNGKDLSFYYSTNSNVYTKIETNPVNGAFLPPWDRAVRAGLISRGSTNQKAVFKTFSIEPIPSERR